MQSSNSNTKIERDEKRSSVVFTSSFVENGSSKQVEQATKKIEQMFDLSNGFNKTISVSTSKFVSSSSSSFDTLDQLMEKTVDKDPVSLIDSLLESRFKRSSSDETENTELRDKIFLRQIVGEVLEKSLPEVVQPTSNNDSGSATPKYEVFISNPLEDSTKEAVKATVEEILDPQYEIANALKETASSVSEALSETKEQVEENLSEPEMIKCEIFKPEETQVACESPAEIYKPVIAVCELFKPSTELHNSLSDAYTKIYNISKVQYDLLSGFWDAKSDSGLLKTGLLEGLMNGLIKKRNDVEATENDVRRALETVDQDQDGKVSFDQFLEFFLLFFQAKII